MLGQHLTCAPGGPTTSSSTPRCRRSCRGSAPSSGPPRRRRRLLRRWRGRRSPRLRECEIGASGHRRWWVVRVRVLGIGRLHGALRGFLPFIGMRASGCRIRTPRPPNASETTRAVSYPEARRWKSRHVRRWRLRPHGRLGSRGCCCSSTKTMVLVCSWLRARPLGGRSYRREGPVERLRARAIPPHLEVLERRLGASAVAAQAIMKASIGHSMVPHWRGMAGGRIRIPISAGCESVAPESPVPWNLVLAVAFGPLLREWQTGMRRLRSCTRGVPREDRPQELGRPGAEGELLVLRRRSSVIGQARGQTSSTRKGSSRCAQSVAYGKGNLCSWKSLPGPGTPEVQFDWVAKSWKPQPLAWSSLARRCAETHSAPLDIGSTWHIIGSGP